MATQEQIDAQAAALQRDRIIYQWMRKHVKDYNPNSKNSEALGQYLTTYGLQITDANLEQGFQVLKSKGYNFTGGGDNAGQDADGLPAVPGYMAHVKTVRDIRNLDPKTFRQYSTGPDSAAFQKRIQAIQLKAQEAGG